MTTSQENNNRVEPHLERIVVSESRVLIRDIAIPDRDFADFMRRVPDEERTATLIQVVQIGCFCLGRAQTTKDTDFVRRQVESLLSDVDTAVRRIPALAEAAFIERIGGNSGQVLSPIAQLVADVSRVTSSKLNDVRELLSRDIDPSKESSTVGRALRSLRDLLDSNRVDSVQACIQAAVAQMTGENGAIAKSVKAVVTEAMQPLQTQLLSIAMESRGRDAAAEAIAQTTAKGLTYEEEVVRRLKSWSVAIGCEVEHVGHDNQPGDVVLKIPENSIMTSPISIVVESRDRQNRAGRKVINDTLVKAMEVRNSDAAIYISRTQDGLAQEIGEWAEGTCERGCWVACEFSASVRDRGSCERLR